MIHYMKDRLSCIPERQAQALHNFLSAHHCRPFIITNTRGSDDGVFRKNGHSYGPFTRDIIMAGPGNHELENLATEQGMSTDRDKLDWMVQFLTLHMHRLKSAWGFLHELANRWQLHPKWSEDWRLDRADVRSVLDETNEALEDWERLPTEVLIDLTNIIICLEPIRQALLFQVIVPYHANQVYATKDMHRGREYFTETTAVCMCVKVTNQLHPPGYALTIKVAPDPHQGYAGWAEWIDMKTRRAPSSLFDAKGLQIGDTRVFNAEWQQDRPNGDMEYFSQIFRGVVQYKTHTNAPNYHRITSMKIQAIAPLEKKARD